MRNKVRTGASVDTGLRWVLLVLVVGLTACGRDGEPAVPGELTAPPSSAVESPISLITLTEESSRYAKLELAEVGEREILVPIESTGRVALNEDRTIRVGAFIDGRVVKVQVRVGDRVREGQVLAEIHSHDVHEAGANLVQARAGLTQRRNQAAFARTSLERAERLFQAKALSKQELERTRVEYESSQQDVVHAEAELERAKGHLEILGLSPEKLEYDALVQITAPISGIIMERQVTAGSSVNPGDPLFTLSDLGQVWVVAEVDEKRLSELRVGLPVAVEVAAYAGREFTGTIAKIGDRLNPQTRMVEVRCLIDNRSGLLKPEMYTVTRIGSGQSHRALMAPRSALQDVDGHAVIFVARDGRTFEKREVRTGRPSGDLIEIVDGVRSGEKVVAGGGFLLKSEMQKSRMSEE